MRAGMASSATRRRFSREPVIIAVSSGASSVTRSRLRLATSILAIRCGGSGGGFAPFLRTTGGSGNDTMTTLPAWSPLRDRITTWWRSIANSPARSTRARCA